MCTDFPEQCLGNKVTRTSIRGPCFVAELGGIYMYPSPIRVKHKTEIILLSERVVVVVVVVRA